MRTAIGLGRGRATIVCAATRERRRRLRRRGTHWEPPPFARRDTTRCYKPETSDDAYGNYGNYRVVSSSSTGSSSREPTPSRRRSTANGFNRRRSRPHARTFATRNPTRAGVHADQGTLGAVSIAGGDGVGPRHRARPSITSRRTRTTSSLTCALPSDGSVPTPGIPGTSRSLGGGRYRLTVVAPRGGAYSIDARLGDVTIGFPGDFPLRGLTFADPPWTSRIRTRPARVAVAGEPSSFTVQLRDSAGAARLGAGESLFARVDLGSLNATGFARRTASRWSIATESARGSSATPRTRRFRAVQGKVTLLLTRSPSG